MKKRMFCLALCLCLLCSVLVIPTAASHVCTDADHDGWCDSCDELMPHYCSTCNGDAYCDICYQVMKHTCMYVEDYAICGKCFETAEHDCMDTDRDYWCDICFGWLEHTCKDSDRDYLCDLCGFILEHDCVDSDGDYWCDICEDWLVHDCVDDDADGYCDVCWYPLEHDCADVDGDGYCDICYEYLYPMDLFPTVGGKVSSGLDVLEPVYIDIYDPEGTYINFGILTGDDPSYEMMVFADETYSVAVSKANHVTRTYSLKVNESPVKLDLSICPIGDVSGDGSITMGDIAKLYAHIRGTAPLTDDYALECAEVSGDTKLTMGDISKLYAHIRGTSLLW